MTKIGIAGHTYQGRNQTDCFWIGVPGAKIGDWYNWPVEGASHRGSVRRGSNGDNYGEENLKGEAAVFWRLLCTALEDPIKVPGGIEELWFGPKFPNLGTMFRVRLNDPGDRERAIETVKEAALQVWPDAELVELEPMS